MLQLQHLTWFDVMKTKYWYIILLFLIVSCTESEGYKKKLKVPCKNLEPQEVEVIEFNKVLFAIDTANFEEEYRALLPLYPEILYDDPDAAMLRDMKEFVSDTFLLRINELVNETFPNIELVADEVKDVYQHYKYYFPDWTVPPTFACVSGVYYNRPVSIGDESIMIGLDYYLSNKDLVYDRVGLPRYMSRRCQPIALTRDLAEELYYHTNGKRVNQKSVLAEMIEQGKHYYFIEAMNPSLPDSVILGYSARQMEWADDNEGQVWATVVGNDMLFNNDLKMRRMLFNDGPFTSAFSDQAPARLGDYLGLKIVRSFMSNNDETLTTLLKMNDYQDILQRSQYKPRK